MRRRTRWIAPRRSRSRPSAGHRHRGRDRGDDHDQPITGDALTRAIAHAGGGLVTGTEVGEEEGYYEVEVTLSDGRQVDVHSAATSTSSPPSPTATPGGIMADPALGTRGAGCCG